MADLKVMVEAKNKEYSTIFRSKDWKNLSKLYAEDCTFMPPGIPMHRGREGLAECLAAFISRHDMFQVTLNTEDIICAGNELVIERGNSLVYKKDGTIVEDGKYINVWKRVDGTLQLYVDIWNTNNAA